MSQDSQTARPETETAPESEAPAAASASTPAIVLVEPQLGENIGMVARAMANFGLGDLRLVNPRDGWPNDKARATASRADHVIDAVRLFDTCEAACADLTYVLATTARPRDSFKPVLGPDTAAGELRARQADGQSCGILFGRERWGLNNDEVGLADAIVTFPVEASFASLNIAQAVLLMSYAYRSADAAPGAGPRFSAPEVPPADKRDLYNLFDHLEQALERTGYFHPPEKQPTMVRNLRTMLTRADLSEPEVRTLRGVIRSFEYAIARAGEPKA